MSENSFISIRNATIASIIAGIVLLAIPVLREYVVYFFNWLWSGVVWCSDSLAASYYISGWVCLLLFILSFIGMVNIYLSIKGESEKPEFELYREDLIYGAKWRWKWIGSECSNIWCFCPHCDATLVYDDSSCRSLYSNISKTDFICENCHRSIIATITGGNKEYAVGAVKREIERRIRTGEYRNH